MNGQHNTKEILFSLLLILIWKKLKIEVCCPSFLGKRVPLSFGAGFGLKTHGKQVPLFYQVFIFSMQVSAKAVFYPYCS